MKKAVSFAKTAAITLGVVAVLVIVAAVGYTWYMSQQPSVLAAAPDTPPPSPPKPAKPTSPTPGSNVGVAVQSFVESAAKGEKVTLTIKTTATADCTATPSYGEDAKAGRPLENQIADEYGMASWQWAIPENAPKGKWPVTVTCTFGKKSGMAKPDLMVK